MQCVFLYTGKPTNFFVQYIYLMNSWPIQVHFDISLAIYYCLHNIYILNDPFHINFKSAIQCMKTK